MSAMRKHTTGMAQGMILFASTSNANRTVKPGRTHIGTYDDSHQPPKVTCSASAVNVVLRLRPHDQPPSERITSASVHDSDRCDEGKASADGRGSQSVYSVGDRSHWPGLAKGSTRCTQPGRRKAKPCIASGVRT
eukprot:56124-Prorocentrum_minimum.AAC.2